MKIQYSHSKLLGNIQVETTILMADTVKRKKGYYLECYPKNLKS